MEEEFIDSASDNQAPLLEIADQPSRDFLELFTKLDPSINGEIIEKAWKQYDTIGQQIILEGNPSVWMSCAFFTSVWKSTPIGHHELICHYSLLKLIELCKVSVLDFFDKLNKWADMILATRRLLDFVNRVQSNLAVSTVIFKKFLPIFRHVFAKQKPSSLEKHLTSAELFDFIWLFFISMQKQLPSNNEDLMNSYNLLLCVVDYIYNAISISRLKNHLNVEFVKSHSNNGKTPLEILCEKFEGASLDTKHLSIHWLHPKLLKLVVENLIPFDIVEDKFNNFTAIRKALEQLYERKMMARSEVDERIFLKPLLSNGDIIFSDKFGEEAVSVLSGDLCQYIDNDFLVKFSSQNCLAKLNAPEKIQPPAEGKSYMITPDTVCQNSAFYSDMKQIERMEELLSLFRSQGKSFNFDFVDCHGNPREYIAEQVHTFGQKFLAKVKDEEKGSNEKGLEKYAADIETLFYYLLQKILIYDQQRALAMGLEMNVDLTAILQSSEFLVSIYICAVDLIFWVNEDLRTFKWVTELFSDNVAPLEFYRIFELIVRADSSFSREMVKHLNQVEECVLEELAWIIDSPIWTALQNSRAIEQFGESSAVPSSQILSKFTGVVQRNKTDLTPQVINFFKKVYHLSAIRLTDLFERLHIVDDLTKRKIWTLFEHVFRLNIILLKDRHLDQILMCCVYIITKVCSLKTTFQDIIFHYRHQPQASSRVYRNVLMRMDFINKEEDNSTEQIERDDLIRFYNKIFVPIVEDFVKKLYPSGPESKENVFPLTSMPKTSVNPLSPRKVIGDRINVIPLSQYSQTIARHRSTRRFDIYKSPSKDLRTINAMVNRGLPTYGGQKLAYSYQ
ncbi:hypothetical protein ACQ4LE_000642 [Meloidogyne hapla]|uniref:RB_A domain-containing protein n=1 Tax=Meloidogyne hapla TaxID=6305 RepID=A0A1I8B6X8_MELHA